MTETKEAPVRPNPNPPIETKENPVTEIQLPEIETKDDYDEFGPGTFEATNNAPLLMNGEGSSVVHEIAEPDSVAGEQILNPLTTPGNVVDADVPDFWYDDHGRRVLSSYAPVSMRLVRSAPNSHTVQEDVLRQLYPVNTKTPTYIQLYVKGQQLTDSALLQLGITVS